MATTRLMRTAPLWGLSQTAPYLHSGEADTIDEAIRTRGWGVPQRKLVPMGVSTLLEAIRT
ncbi:MAG: hypothetical protein HC863_01595, partial [Myxococcales bacterium]|nr:hypothetical protein [Myxococcales bacterium]